ncbi:MULTISPECIES: hypothetical protein [unclassified Roseovarius]|uniref:hypothetical protein n=1 Tax=unclassified Roseovarius TaxID=2614913 RepID=UPI00273F0124|nr:MULTISPECIES: hypothetical protein [unclassified Roseovarius]
MKSVLRIVGLGVSAILLTATLAIAADYTEAEKQALKDRVSSFQQAFATGDFATIVDVIPPKMLHHMATRANTDASALRTQLIALTETSMKEVVVDDIKMDLDQIRYETTPTDAPYALVPTDFTFTLADGTTLRSESMTLALRDAETWYLVRVQEGAQLLVLTEVYPEFKGVDFGKGRLTVPD